MDHPALAIYCPNQEDHPNKKILMLLNEDEIFIHCPKHGWVKIQLFQGQKKLNFNNVAVKVSDMEPNVNFVLTPSPIMAVGEFRRK